MTKVIKSIDVIDEYCWKRVMGCNSWHAFSIVIFIIYLKLSEL